jgi:lipopolysaccharide biosynthesis regulator YciM
MMDSALIYVLLLLGIAIGWTLGYRFARQAKKSTPDDWMPSVEDLLAQAGDVSLERLLNVSSLDDDSIDLFLKLGKTLREKGEVDRAIHLHQSLFARTDLSKTTLQTLELELAIDFSYAGLLDRAERLFSELLDAKGRVREKASSHLVELYEEEGEWQEIYDLYLNKKIHISPLLARRVSHAVCELAESAVVAGDFLEAQKLSRAALKIDSACARAFVVSGNMAFSQKEYHEAVRCYLRAVEIDSQALISILDPLVDSFKHVGDAGGLLNHLSRHWKETHYVPALVAKIDCLAEGQGPEVAIGSLLQELQNQPSNSGFFSLVEMVVRHKQQLDKSQLLILYDILRRIVENEPKFICKNCGFKAKEPHWRCPSCKNWATVASFVPTAQKAKLDI